MLLNHKEQQTQLIKQLSELKVKEDQLELITLEVGNI
jgi:hypothetical protein